MSTPKLKIYRYHFKCTIYFVCPWNEKGQQILFKFKKNWICLNWINVNGIKGIYLDLLYLSREKRWTPQYLLHVFSFFLWYWNAFFCIHWREEMALVSYLFFLCPFMVSKPISLTHYICSRERDEHPNTFHILFSCF